jgi:excisionase family DNA binding protein
MANTVESGFSPVRQFDPYTRPRPARWPIPGRLSQCLLQPVHVWLTAKLTVTGQVDDASGKNGNSPDPLAPCRLFQPLLRLACAMIGNAQHYLLIGEAAQLLGVSEGTLRNWGRQGKIRTHRHPINQYRLYRRADLLRPPR